MSRLKIGIATLEDYKARTIVIARGQYKPTAERYKLVRLEPGPWRRGWTMTGWSSIWIFDVTPGRGKPSSSGDPLPTYLGGATLV